MRFKNNLARRRFLLGLGGVTMSLPFLEIFANQKASAAPAPLRYALMFAGFSIGSNEGSMIAPTGDGLVRDLITPGLQPLADLGVADQVSFLSGLEIPVSRTTTPAAMGRSKDFHSTSHQVIFTGNRSAGGSLPGESSDWKAARALGETRKPVLNYRVQPAFYRVDSAGTTDGRSSSRINESGELEHLEPISSPRAAFQSLFEGFVPPDPAEAAEAQRLLAMRHSVVDLVANDAEGLLSRLGREDTIRMQRHFDELRTLEGALEGFDMPIDPSCVMPSMPNDPPIGDAIDPSLEIEERRYNDAYRNANGYSDEEMRANIMADLVHMAFTCDISRVSSFMLTYAQCFMNMYTLIDIPSDLHEFTHGAGRGEGRSTQDALATAAAWHVKHFARLVQKLRDTEDFDGRTVLDNTAMALAFEGGWGFDGDTGGNDSPHSTENMVMLTAGHAGGLNPTARHIRGERRHTCAVLNTMLQAVGSTETLGEVTGTIDELLE